MNALGFQKVFVRITRVGGCPLPAQQNIMLDCNGNVIDGAARLAAGPFLERQFQLSVFNRGHVVGVVGVVPLEQGVDFGGVEIQFRRVGVGAGIMRPARNRGQQVAVAVVTLFLDSQRHGGAAGEAFGGPAWRGDHAGRNGRIRGGAVLQDHFEPVAGFHLQRFQRCIQAGGFYEITKPFIKKEIHREGVGLPRRCVPSPLGTV